MLRDRLAERPRVVALVVGALWVLVLTVAIVSGLVGASLADGDSARADRLAAELRTEKDENKQLSETLDAVAAAQKRRQAQDKGRKAERQRDRERERSRRDKARRERERRR